MKNGEKLLHLREKTHRKSWVIMASVKQSKLTNFWMCMYVKKLENSKESEESGILYYLEVNKTNKTETSRFLVK